MKVTHKKKLTRNMIIRKHKELKGLNTFQNEFKAKMQ